MSTLNVNCTCSVMFNWGTSLMFYTLNILAQGDIHYFSIGLHIPQFFLSLRLFGKFVHTTALGIFGGACFALHTQFLIFHEHCLKKTTQRLCFGLQTSFIFTIYRCNFLGMSFMADWQSPSEVSSGPQRISTWCLHFR